MSPTEGFLYNFRGEVGKRIFPELVEGATQLKARVILYTKRNCGLCEKMIEQITHARCDELFTLEEIDIESDPDLFERYRYDIPVLSVNGVEVFRHRLRVEEFRAYLTSLPQG